jgi:hypothetical protein
MNSTNSAHQYPPVLYNLASTNSQLIPDQIQKRINICFFLCSRDEFAFKGTSEQEFSKTKLNTIDLFIS